MNGLSEEGLNWRKSTRSIGNGECIEVADVSNDVAVRDSMNPEVANLRFSGEAWTAFLDGVKAGIDPVIG
jgi:hypothetical protein